MKNAKYALFRHKSKFNVTKQLLVSLIVLAFSKVRQDPEPRKARKILTWSVLSGNH